MTTKKVTIGEFYSGRSVLITGGTGFVGKVLIEKLLRSCESIGNIYILIRSKKSLEPKQRLEELLASEVFQRVRHDRPGVLSKVIPITGDVELPALNISESDVEKLMRDVSVVFHLAASLKFDEPLKTSLVKNVLGTKRVMTLCRKLPLLEAIVHLSTAFCNYDRTVIEEKIYPFPTAATRIIDTIKWLDNDTSDLLVPKLLGEKPNTYIYTKALTETFLGENCPDLPLTIVRPGIVACSWKEPFPGWVDCVHGATGLFIAIMKGVLRSMHCKQDRTFELIPVDSVVNCIIASAWHVAINRPREIPVYNCVTNPVNKLTWKEGHNLFYKYSYIYPSIDLFRQAPRNILTDSKLMYAFWKTVSHTIPAYCLDWAMLLLRKKRRFVRLYEKVHAVNDLLEPFTTGQWTFKYQNIDSLRCSMDICDRIKYNFDVRGINWDAYGETYFLGIRKYLLKEDPSSLQSARQILKRRMMYEYAAYVMLCLAILRLAAYLWPSYSIWRILFTFVKVHIHFAKRR